MVPTERLRRAAAADRALAGVLLVAAALLYFGVWRVSPHQLVPDEVAATTQPFLLFYGEPGLTRFEKGGNLHVWLLALVSAPVVLVLGAYWLVTGQLDAVYDAATDLTAYTAGGQWDAADPRVLDAYYLVVTGGRVLSATAGLATVLGVALLARRCYDRRAGVVAAATLTASLGFVLTAKFATEDVVAACLATWTLVVLARHHRTSSTRALLAGAGLAGLAVSAKATTGLLVGPVAVMAVRHHGDGLRTRPRAAMLSLARYPLAAVGAYVLTTPSLVLNPGAYLAELARYVAVRAGDATYYGSPDPGAVAHLGHLATALGGPLLVLALVATTAVVALTATGRLHSFTWYPLSVAVPYSLVISSWSNVQYNRALLLLPFLAVFVGAFVGWATDRDRPTLRRVVGPVVAAVLVVSLVYTAAGAATWSTSRSAASAWTHDNLDASSEVVTLGKPIYLPTFPAEANVTGAVVDPMYDRHDPTRKRRAVARVRCNRADYVVLTSFHYERYFEDPSVAPALTRLYDELLSGGDYEVDASFGPDAVVREKSAAERLRRSLRLAPPSRNTNNPRILVLERVAPPEPDCPGLDS